MIQCQNCGQVNNYGSNFCRFCGTRMVIPQNTRQVEQHTAPLPPRPYMWKTDEYSVEETKSRNTRQIKQVQPLTAGRTVMAAPPVFVQTAPYYQTQSFAHNYRCPRCGTNYLPKIQRRISAAGWVVFAVLLVFFFPLFWVGLLLKENTGICPVCNIRLY